MTDLVSHVMVALDKDYREDDVQVVLAAISMIKGVLSVEPAKAGMETWMAESRAKHELKMKLLELLK